MKNKKTYTCPMRLEETSNKQEMLQTRNKFSGEKVIFFKKYIWNNYNMSLTKSRSNNHYNSDMGIGFGATFNY